MPNVLINDVRTGYTVGSTQLVTDATASVWIGNRWALLADTVAPDPLSAQEQQSAPATNLSAAEVALTRGLVSGAGIRPASYYGVVAGAADMTAQMTLALNASVADGKRLVLPYGTINISDEILVTVGQNIVNWSTAAGGVIGLDPIEVAGYGSQFTRIVQNTPGKRHFYYTPSAGVIENPVFRDFRLVNANPDYTESTTGQKQAGIQLGGKAGSDIVTLNAEFINVAGEGLYAVVRVDDCTGLRVTGLLDNSRFRYYVEGGYNSDLFKFENLNASYDAPQDISCANTSGTNAITGISTAITPYLVPGMGVTGAGIPADTTILTVASTSITISNNTTASVSVFCSHLGTLLSLLKTDGTQYTGSGFATVANNANYSNKTRSSDSNIVTFNDVVFNRAQSLIESYGNSYNLAIRQVYMERMQRIMNLRGTGLKGLAVDGLFLSQPQTLRQNWIEIASSTPNGYIRNITTDGSPNSSVAVNLPNLSASSEVGPFVVENGFGVVQTAAGPALSSGSRRVVLGAIENGTAVWQYNTNTGNANFDGLGIDTIEVTISTSGNAIIGPNSVQIVPYRKLKFIFISATASSTVAMQTFYKKADGTNWGTITAGTVGQRATLEFTYTGTAYISAQQTLAWA